MSVGRNAAAFALLAALAHGDTHAQGTRADYARAEALLPWNVAREIRGLEVKPQWIRATDRFCYRLEGSGHSELMEVDPARNVRKRVVDTAPECAAAPAPVPVESGEVAAPDGRRAAFVRDHDLYVRSFVDGREVRLTTDGVADYAYGEWADSHLLSVTAQRNGTERPARVLWSPDSRRLLSYRVDQRAVPPMPFVEAVPKEGYGHRPTLYTARVPFPGDLQITTASLVIFDVVRGARIGVRDEPLPLYFDLIDSGFTWWDESGERVFYVHEQRGLRRVRLMAADADSGETRTIVDETSPTYIEDAYGESGKAGMTRSDAFWLSPRDGWMHLYRYDVRSGRLISQVTQGSWAVDTLQRVDAPRGWLYFTAGGRESGRDPYFLHLYRARFDGSQLTLLTPEDAHHEVSFSPAGNYFVDRYSRVDTPPVTVLRGVDGRLVQVLAKADIGALVARGWSKPERFSAKARDGSTDVYGVLFRPTRFDPAKKYPVVDHVYGGPQTIYGPRSFSPGEPVAELGFIVVQMDGMGTPGRSKAFQDVSYGKGFAEAGGLADHVAAIRELAVRYPYMDLDRVGIYGHSGGGYATVRGMLGYPDFYKVGVASAGSHDQSLYEARWGEQYIGRPGEEPAAYALQANSAFAGKLEGKLLLMHGDVDDDVPVTNTMQLAHALIVANRNFDLLIMPGYNHETLNRDPYALRKRWDYLAHHLLGVTPPEGYRIVPP